MIFCAGLLLLALPVSAQESVGFAEPSDLESLLAYRLPDWGWRRISAWGLVESGGNSAPTDLGDFNGAKDLFYQADLNLGLRWVRESESVRRSLAVTGQGRWFRSSQHSTWFDDSERLLHGRVDIDGSWDRYLTTDGFFVATRLLVASSYTDYEGWDSFYYVPGINGGYGHVAEAGGGWGRVRDVRPLLRAQRLAERLTALGRPRPRRAQVLAAAEIIARRGGYGAIYDRPDRRFWQDVLGALTGEGELELAEILFLEDVLAEDLGDDRAQGFEVRAGGAWTQDGTGDEGRATLGAWARVTASRNLSLDHQLSGSVEARLDDPEDGTARYLEAGLRHQWVVADRLVLLSSLSYRSYRLTDDHIRSTNRRAEIGTVLRFRLEDRLRFVPGLAAWWMEGENEVGQSCSWYRLHQWSASIAFEVLLDGVVF
jgi:hypothetical protein